MDPAFDSHDLTMTTHFYFVALVFTLGMRAASLIIMARSYSCISGTLTSYFLTRMSDLHEGKIIPLATSRHPYCHEAYGPRNVVTHSSHSDTIWSSSDLRPFCAISMFLFTVIFDLVSTLVLLFVSHLDGMSRLNHDTMIP